LAVVDVGGVTHSGMDFRKTMWEWKWEGRNQCKILSLFLV
jgi:hypothetical protein